MYVPYFIGFSALKEKQPSSPFPLSCSMDGRLLMRGLRQCCSYGYSDGTGFEAGHLGDISLKELYMETRDNIEESPQKAKAYYENFNKNESRKSDDIQD